MSDIAIRVENISKRYRIGQQEPYKALRDVLTNTFSAPFRRLRSALAGSKNSSEPTLTDNYIWALKDVSFDIKQGEVVGIIGKNGSGKTTLLKILSRTTEPTEGYAEIYGRVGSLLEVGTGFHPELTGRENIYLNAAILGMKKAEINRKFDEIVAFAEIEKFLDTPVKHYSSGMYMRLAFAVAAHLEPEILLVDEVLAVGDLIFQKKCIGKMGDVAREGRTVVIVSHNMLTLQSLCERGILLTSGKISAEGNITAVVNRYSDFEKKRTGEVFWDSPDVAPGNERSRLKAVRIVSEGIVTGEVDISKDFLVEIDYWNLQANGRRMISIHLYNSKGVFVLATGNLPSVSVSPDPWQARPYPVGLFRTSCVIPGYLLNDGPYNVSVVINGEFVSDLILNVPDVLSFNIKDKGHMREEYSGEWLGAVRVRLAWQTVQLS